MEAEDGFSTVQKTYRVKIQRLTEVKVAGLESIRIFCRIKKNPYKNTLLTYHEFYVPWHGLQGMNTFSPGFGIKCTNMA